MYGRKVHDVVHRTMDTEMGLKPFPYTARVECYEWVPFMRMLERGRRYADY